MLARAEKLMHWAVVNHESTIKQWFGAENIKIDTALYFRTFQFFFLQNTKFTRVSYLF